MSDKKVLIVGFGPASCAAALTLARRGITPDIADHGTSALALARRVDNYPGCAGQTGQQMLSLFRAEVVQSGANILPARVLQLLPAGKQVMAAIGDKIQSYDAVLLCTGKPVRPVIQNEDTLLGRGVSCCATCDGMLYKKRVVIVIGSDDDAVRDANFLAGIAAKVMYIPEKAHDLSALSDSIEIIREKPLAILGETEARGVKTDTRDIEADGVFILRPAAAPEALLPGLTTKDGGIVHDEFFRTAVPHVFVAGDAAGAPYQAAKAVGEGNRAALQIAAELE